MMLFRTLSFFSFVVIVINGLPQKTYTSIPKIPVFTLDKRVDCGIEELLSNLSIPSCDYALPSDRNYWLVSPAALCFGMYDTLYEFCKHHPNRELKIPQYQVTSFCGRTNKSMERYDFHNGHDEDPLFLKWVNILKKTLTRVDECTDVCVHGTEINPQCAVVVAALESLPVNNTVTSLPSSSSVTPSLHPVENSVVDVNKMKNITTAEIHNQPSHSTKEYAPGPADTKTPEREVAVEPVKKADDIKKVVPEKTPQPEAVKSKQDVKPYPAAVSKTENPDMQSPVPVPELAEEDNVPDEDTQLDQSDPEFTPPKDAPDLQKLPSDEIPGKQDPSDSFQDNTMMMPRVNDDSEETNMVTYFILMTGGALIFYIAFHNKNKLLALALEGRRSGRRGGRHSSAAYSKLHPNLEETISAGGPTSPSATHFLY